ncbi:MAG: hypothetical protein HC888_06975 [Candidatus Competibacteraceae bacterium]|nr:hypothetical protein [Candidatus Competibacteraceae bacterium]
MGRFNAASYADLTAHWTTTNNFSHAEVWSHQAYIDVTGIAQTAFTAGATVTFDGWIAAVYRGVASAGFGMSVSAELLITYEYDDTATNLLITHILPIDSLTGILGTTLGTIGGTGGVPDLAADIIKESSYTIRDLYFRFVFNLNMAGTTDFSFAAALDSESEVTLATFDAAASGDPYMEVVWRRTDMSVTDAHDLKARVTSAAGATPEHVGALLIVTYEFPSSSTTRTHTMVMPRELNQTFGTGTTAADRFIRFVEFDIEDTNPVLLRGGGLMVTHQSADPGSLLFRFGTQSYASYTVTPGDVSGPVPFIQRFDAGAVVGTGGLALARGKNTLNMEGYYTTSPQLGGAISALIFLTYSYTKTTGKQPSTACFNAHLASSSDTWAISTRQSKTGSFQWFIPEAIRRVQVAGLDMIDNTGSADTMARLRIALGADKGYFLSPGTLTGIDANVGVRKFVCEVSGFKEYPEQPSTQWACDPTAGALNTVMDGTATTRMMSALCWANWHDYTYTISGTVSQYADSDGAGLTVEIWDADEKRLIATVTTTAGGAFTADIYDNTRNKRAVCYEDATHHGASKDATPGTGFDILMADIPGGGGSGISKGRLVNAGG